MMNSALRDLFHAPASVRVALIMTALCIYPLWIAIRDFPHRSYWLLLVPVGVGIAIRIPGLPAGDAADYWYRDASLGLGLALFAVGALDHLMLVLALGGGTRAAGATEDVRL